MKKSKKKLKGMTLIEMIISIFIFALMGGLLILVGTHIDATSKATNNLKNKVLVESPYAANHINVYGQKADGTDKVLDKEDLDITVKIHASGTYWKNDPDPDNPGKYNKIEKPYGDADGNVVVNMKAIKYTTEKLVTEGMTDDEIAEMQKKANGQLNLDFFDVQPETATP